MSKEATQVQAIVNPVVLFEGILQRKCDCGNHTIAGDECGECSKNKLQRKSAGYSEFNQVPPIVHDVLRSPGQPLDTATRAFFEPRFGRDFSQVRVHADSRAADSASAVSALAYTVGQNVVFGAGQYAPNTSSGEKLLAHELTHVIQQRSNNNLVQGAREITDPSDAAEREAEAASRNFRHENAAIGISQSPLRIARQKDPPKKDEPKKDEDPPKKKEPPSHAKRALTADEKKLISGKVKGAAPGGSAMAFKEGPRFVLHDTSGRVELEKKEQKKVQAEVEQQMKKKPGGKKDELEKELSEKERLGKERRRLEEHQREERGPLEDPAHAYVPSAGTPVIARPSFFDAKRPTATEYEKRNELVGLKDREEAFQKIWKATKSTEQQNALDASLTGLEVSATPTGAKKETESELKQRAIKERKMTPGEITKEKTDAKKDLEKTLDPTKTKKGKPQIFTTASWAIAKICERLKSSPAKDVAGSAADAKELETTCKKMGTYFDQRDPRVGSSVNVEIIQVAGSACATDEKKTKLIPIVPYTENQYTGVAQVYLQSALQAGQFPEITTHFWLDRKNPGAHCDPRCFDLQHLYDVVGNEMGHAKGSTYGDKPNYGTTQGTHNVWWHNKVCNGSHP